MVNAPSNNHWLVYLTLLLALMLSAFPLPAVMQWAWPEWVPLVCIYWVLALPHRFNLGLAFIIGLLLDLLQYNFLGMNALAMVVTVFFAAMLYRRMRMYRVWQQAFVIGLLIAINQFIGYWGQSLGGNTTDIWMIFLPALTSAIVWPWLFVVLRGLRRAFRVA